MSSTTVEKSDYRVDDVVRIGRGTYAGWQAKVRKVFTRLVDVALIADASGNPFARTTYVTLRTEDVDLEVIARPKPDSIGRTRGASE